MNVIAIMRGIGQWHKKLWADFEHPIFGDAPVRSESEVLRDYFSFAWIDRAIGLD